MTEKDYEFFKYLEKILKCASRECLEYFANKNHRRDGVSSFIREYSKYHL